jgi:hypothetical protein
VLREALVAVLGQQLVGGFDDLLLRLWVGKCVVGWVEARVGRLVSEQVGQNHNRTCRIP